MCKLNCFLFSNLSVSDVGTFIVTLQQCIMSYPFSCWWIFFNFHLFWMKLLGGSCESFLLAHNFMSLGGTPRIWISIKFKISKNYKVRLQNGFHRKHKRAVLVLRENPIRTSQKTKEWTQVYYAHQWKKVLELIGTLVPSFNKWNRSNCSMTVCIFIWNMNFIPKSRNTY